MSTSEPVRQEEDRIQTGKIVAVGLMAFIAFGIGILWAARIQTRGTGSIRTQPQPWPAQAGQREIGMVYQPLFDSLRIAQQKESAKRAQLNSYGWVDREARVARIPIQRAMKMLLERGGKR